jgi:hypothetical protein
MKIKLLNILNSKQVLEKLGSETSFDAVIAYRIAKNIKALSSEFASFEEARINLIKKYGKEKEGGKEGEMEILKENMLPYEKDISALLLEEVEISIIPIKVSNLKNVSPNELLLIDWMLKEEED